MSESSGNRVTGTW